ncbi:hypothetical protein OSTOST_25424, partial [Ostertagia ostertagi]
MLDELAFLIKGHDGITDRQAKFNWLRSMFEVCKERPVRFRGKKVSPDFLHANLLIRLSHFNMEELAEDVNNILDTLRILMSRLYLLVVLVCITDFQTIVWLENSFDFPNSCQGSTLEFCSVPRLPWDITPALNGDIAIPDITREEPIEASEICPLDSRGMISQQYAELLASDVLRLAESENGSEGPCRILFF